MSNPPLPAVSVIMGVYNGERYLSEAVRSILNQSFRDFEFIVINDGSTDRTGEILSNFKDARLILIENEKNSGLTTSLNIGLRRARGVYVARMDGDDISLPTRLEIEKKFLDAHPDIASVGSAIRVIDAEGTAAGSVRNVSTDPEIIRFQMLTMNALVHSSVMFRRTSIEKVGAYDERFRQMQDYDLWSRLLRQGERVANINEPLVCYRFHEKSVTQREHHNASYNAALAEIRRKNISQYYALSNRELQSLQELLHYRRINSFRTLILVWLLWGRLAKAYVAKVKPPEQVRDYIRNTIRHEHRQALRWYGKYRFSTAYTLAKKLRVQGDPSSS